MIDHALSFAADHDLTPTRIASNAPVANIPLPVVPIPASHTCYAAAVIDEQRGIAVAVLPNGSLQMIKWDER